MSRWARLDAGEGSPEADSQVHKMVLNIGKRPTVQDGAGLTVEAHVLHTFAEDFYGRDLRLLVTGYLRCTPVCQMFSIVHFLISCSQGCGVPIRISSNFACGVPGPVSRSGFSRFLFGYVIVQFSLFCKKRTRHFVTLIVPNM